ncbi:MAG: hypothetical protein RL685_3510 [Pseudomonadota bacterium]
MLKSKVYALTISLLLGAVAHAQVPDAVSPAPARDSLSPRPVVPPVPSPPPLRNEPALRNEPPRSEAAQPSEPARGRVVEALQGLTDWVRGRGGSLSARVVDADSGVLWAESAPQSALNPASNMKILTAAVALERLGAEFRFNTGLYGKQDGARIESLVLRGQGDPSLETADLWELARALRNLGVSQVGQVLVDQSRFDDQFVPPAFEQQPNEWAPFRAPVSAVALERNALTLNLLPGELGQPARAWVEPAGIASVEGSVETRKPGSGEAVQLTLETRGNELVAHLGGHVARGLPRFRFERRLEDPRRAPGLALRELLLAAGITVRDGVALGGEQVEGRLVFHQSAPLGELVSQLGKNSDNFYAEMLFKALGADATATPARSQDGARVVLQWLTEHGLSTPETRINNGSGLFDANRISAATLVGTLLAVRRNPAVYPEFLAQLAVGGVDGTLRSRFRRFKEQRLVRAKTGTLSAAVGLSGYVLSPSGSPIAFAILVNGLEGQASAVRERIDRVVDAVAEARR